MTKSSPSSRRVALRLVGAIFAVSVGAVAGISSQTPASAAACQGCVLVWAPTIGLNVTAQPGKQAVIDQEGGVAVYTPLTTATIGGPGTVWLVGHRTTHGAVFNRVPSLQPGDLIDLVDDAGAHRYVVSRLVVVSESAWQREVDIHDTSVSRLILQTSHPDSDKRYLVEAFGIGIAPAPLAPPTPAAAPTTTQAPAVMAGLARTTKFGSIKSAV